MRRFKSLGWLVLTIFSALGSAILTPFFFMLGFGMGMILLFFCVIVVFGLGNEFVVSINQPLIIKK